MRSYYALHGLSHHLHNFKFYSSVRSQFALQAVPRLWGVYCTQAHNTFHCYLNYKDNHLFIPHKLCSFSYFEDIFPWLLATTNFQWALNKGCTMHGQAKPLTRLRNSRRVHYCEIKYSIDIRLWLGGGCLYNHWVSPTALSMLILIDLLLQTRSRAGNKMCLKKVEKIINIEWVHN